MIDVQWHHNEDRIILVTHPSKHTWQDSDDAFATIQTWVLASPHPIMVVYVFPDQYTVLTGVLKKAPVYFRWYYEHIEYVYFVNTNALIKQFGKLINKMFVSIHHGRVEKFVFAKHLSDIPALKGHLS
jgi:hypothetical protein